MSKIKFSNDVIYNINDGASLFSITISAGVNLDAVLTQFADSANFSRIEFLNDNGQVTGAYQDMLLLDSHFIVNLDGSVTFGIREKTEIELRLEVLEASQEVQDEAIVDLAEIVGGE